MEFLSLYGYLILMIFVGRCLAAYNISDYRLITKNRPNAGIVEAFVEGIGWGIICQDDWDYEEAGVVCHHLSFPGTSLHLRAVSFNDEDDDWPIYVTKNITTKYTECTRPANEMKIECETFSSDPYCVESWIVAVTCKEPGYLGCFEDSNTFGLGIGRVFLDGPRDYRSSLTIDICINLCNEGGFYYAGVENRYECFCGRKYEQYDRHGGKLSDNECTGVCSGDRLESCGSSDRIGIYQVNLGVCDDPGTPTNGFRYNETDSLRYGNKLYFNCSDGYILEGPDVIQCVKTYSRKDVNIVNSSHVVMWNKDPPRCTEIGSTSPSNPLPAPTTETTPYGPGTTLGVSGQRKQEGQEKYIGIGIAFGLFIIVVVSIIAIYARKRHNRRAEKQAPVIPASDQEMSSRNHGDGGDRPLVQRADEEEDLFVLTELTAHSNTAGENHYTGALTDERPPTQPGSADRPGISRDRVGYESIRLPSTDTPANGSGVTMGDDSPADLYANTEFHDVPTNMIDNELYG